MFIDIICKRVAKHVFQDGGKHTEALLSSTVACDMEKKKHRHTNAGIFTFSSTNSFLHVLL